MTIIKRSAYLATFCAALAVTAPASAGGPPRMSPATQSDVQCLVAIMSTATQMEKIKPGSSQIAMMYYFGRLDGDDPHLDMEAAIRWQMSKMTMADISATDVRCGNQLTARGHAMQTIGQHLQANPSGR